MDHEPVLKAVASVGQSHTADLMRKAAAAGVPWNEILTQMLNLALPAFLAWLQSRLHPTPPPTPAP